MTNNQESLIPGPSLIVMAAGLGRRFGGLKQMEPVGPNGEIILDYSIFDAKQAGFGKIIFVINREIEQAFRARIANTIGKYCETVFVTQELGNLPSGIMIPEGRRKPWGTAHAVLSCELHIDRPFVVINADDFYGRSAFEMLCGYLKKTRSRTSRYDFCMVGYYLKNTLTEHGHVARGVCKVDQDGCLEEVRERTRIKMVNRKVKYSDDGQHWNEIDGESVVSMNMWGFTPELFPELEKGFVKFLGRGENELSRSEYYLPEVVNQLLKEGAATVKVLPSDEKWFGMTYKEDIEVVRSAVSKLTYDGIYPQTIWD